jgi:hypothetical protein
MRTPFGSPQAPADPPRIDPIRFGPASPHPIRLAWRTPQVWSRLEPRRVADLAGEPSRDPGAGFDSFAVLISNPRSRNRDQFRPSH